MRVRHPSEFVHTPINLMPLINAAWAKDWVLVNNLLESGYSLLWIDAALSSTAIYILAKEAADDEIIAKLLDISIKEHGMNSKAHQFVVTEAIMGKLDNKHNCRMDEIRDRCNRLDYMACDSAASMESRFHDINYILDGRQITPNILYRLCRGGHDTTAIKILPMFKDPKYSDYDRKQVLAAIMRGSANNFKVDLDTVAFRSQLALGMKNQYPLLVCIAEAVASNQEEWAFEKIKLPRIINDDDLDITLGDATISAARRGRADVIFKLCDIMEKVDLIFANPGQPSRFTPLLSCAVAAALVNEHFSLAKILMKMVPEFNALPEDLAELNAWPQCKVKRMFSLIRDCKLFTDIALHSGIAANVNSPEWIAALKDEYGLSAMSNDGFNLLMHNIDKINQLLLSGGKTIVPAEIGLTAEDINIFQTVANDARKRSKKDSHAAISFFRLNQLVKLPDSKKESPETMQHCVSIRLEIIEILANYQSKLHLFGNSAVIGLEDALHDADSISRIQELLNEKLSGFSHRSLLKECLEVLKKHELNAQSVMVFTSSISDPYFRQ